MGELGKRLGHLERNHAARWRSRPACRYSRAGGRAVSDQQRLGTNVAHAAVWSLCQPLGGETVWTIVNRNEYDVDGDQIEVSSKEGLRYFDLYHGVELKPQTRPSGRTVLTFSIEAKGYGAVLAPNTAPERTMQALMPKMKDLTATPLSNYAHEWKVVPQKIVPIPPNKAATGTPEGMVKIPQGDFLFKVAGIEIEGLNAMGVDVQYPWEDSPRRFHEHALQIKSFYIDKYPVTNAEFKKFVDSSHYHPQDDLHFLRDWNY